LSVIDSDQTTRQWSASDIYSKYEDDFKNVRSIIPTDNITGADLKIREDTLYIIEGANSKVEHIAENLLWLHGQTSNILIHMSEDIDIPYVRDVLKNLCGESSLVMCSDGIVAKTFDLKGFTMSLTLPIWNESETIGEVIESFLPVVDEIIIGVDDKTDDNSFEIVSRYTSKAFYFRWKDSFCKARNICMEKSTCDWNFMTEGHEFLDPNCLDSFKEIKDVESYVSLIRVSRYISENKKMSSWPWITRNGRGCHYINDSHNAVISNIPENNVTKDFYEIKTIHKRSGHRAKARKEQRFYMNRKNLLQDLVRDKDNTRAMFYVAQEYNEVGDYAKALEYWERYLKRATWNEERYQARINSARAYQRLGDLKAAEKHLLNCFTEGVPRNEHMVMLGDLHAKDRPDKSIYYLRMAASVEMMMSPMWVDEAYYREVPLQKLCIIYSSLGRINEALECARLVQEKYPETPGTEDIIKTLEDARKDESKAWDERKSDTNLITA
tara:strand:- start:5014 stop:6504 length:1491 start_codon:yes stop_codon:yes gene_type:complete